MAKKEFQNKYMHPTRRKLVNMVFNGEYESDIRVGYGKSNEVITRKVGDVWEDEDGKIWEQKEGYKIKKSKLTDIMSEIRNDMYERTRCKGEECESKSKYSYTDKKLIDKFTYCSNCLSKLEHRIRVDGNWETYKKWRALNDIVKEGLGMLENLQQAYNEAKQEYEYINQDGSKQTWKMDRPVDEIKADILKDIEKVTEDLNGFKELRQEMFDKLKEYDYELVKL
jgi:hypothetical protein